jgi:hypothetical protein
MKPSSCRHRPPDGEMATDAADPALGLALPGSTGTSPKYHSTERIVATKPRKCGFLETHPLASANSWVGAVATIKGGHELSLGCIKGASPGEAQGGPTVDDCEFVPLTEPAKEGGSE